MAWLIWYPPGDNSSHWVCYSAEGAFCDEHLMQARMSGMALPRTVVYLPVTFGQGLYNLNEMIEKEKKGSPSGIKYSPELYYGLKRSFWSYVDQQSTRHIFTPVCVRGHCGMIAVFLDGNAGVSVKWGHSMMGIAPGNVLNIMIYLIEEVLGRTAGGVLLNSLMADMWFEKQRDEFSCGFYLISVIRIFAVGSVLYLQ